MDNYVNPIPDYSKHILEAETFIQKISDNRFSAEKWSLLWKNIQIFTTSMFQFEKKWNGYKKSTGIAPQKKVIKTDMDYLVHRLDVDILKSESAIEWGLRSSQSMIDELPSLLPYLKRTEFYVYIEEIGNLLEAVIDRTKHSQIMKLLREVRNHSDIIVIGQYCTNEMVEDCKHLRDSKSPTTRNEIIKYIDIYQKLCGIYVKDMILCYCLVQLKETRFRPTYEDAHPDSRSSLDRVNYVKRRINVFGEVYDHNLRNAVAHNDIETDSNKHIVTIYIGSEKQPQTYTYEKVVSITQGMSALIIAFRLLIVILTNIDWRAIRDLLH